MKADRRLLHIAMLADSVKTGTDHHDKLSNIRVEPDDNIIVGCNGSILMYAKFTDERGVEAELNTGLDCPIDASAVAVNFRADAVISAFKEIPKKTYLPALQSVYLGVKDGRHSVSSFPGNAPAIVRDAKPASGKYLSWKQAIAVDSPDDTVVSFSTQNIGLILDAARGVKSEFVTFRIPANTSSGYSHGRSVRFEIPGAYKNTSEEETIHGAVMPCETPENWRNTEWRLILHDDVALMADVLGKLMRGESVNDEERTEAENAILRYHSRRP